MQRDFVILKIFLFEYLSDFSICLLRVKGFYPHIHVFSDTITLSYYRTLELEWKTV